MPLSASISVISPPFDFTDGDSQFFGDDEETVVEIDESKQTTNGYLLTTGRIITQQKVERKRLKFSDYEEKTAERYVLRSDETGRLSLISSEEDGQSENPSIEIDSVVESALNITEFAIIDHRIVLFFGNKPRAAAGAIQRFTNSSIEQISINVQTVIERLDFDDAIEATMSSSWKDVDAFTNSATVTGDLSESDFDQTFSKHGKIEYQMSRISFKNQSITVGISHQGKVILYGAINIPKVTIAEFIMEYEIYNT